MSDIPAGLHYTEEHEYLKPTENEGIYLIGITAYAQGELGDVVYLELPAPGEEFSRMDIFGTIEAVKAVSDLYCPASGEILEVNRALEDEPALVNSDPYGEGWMIKLKLSDPSELDSLLDASGYEELIG